MSKKIFLNQIVQYPQMLDELNKLLVQGAEATIEDGRLVINYDEEKAKTAKSRNAGRKVFGPAKAESYKVFYRLYEEGMSMQEISKETGMSLASCYRYKQDADAINEPPEAIGNKKFLLYRAGDSINKNIRKHVLVAVEYGKDIYDVTASLIRDVEDDLSGLEENSKYDVEAYDPELLCMTRKSKRYKYMMEGLVYTIDQKYNQIVEYGIIEK